MQHKFFKAQDNAEGLLDSNIGASSLAIALETGLGAKFPQPYTGATTSGGTSSTMNKTSIGSSGIAVGDFIENITDGSHAYVLAVNTNSLTTTELQGGSDNTWQNGDTYAVNRFIITLDTRDANGVITAFEKVLIDNRSGDILTVNASGRGYDGSTAQSWVASTTYVNIFVVALHFNELSKAFAEAQQMLNLRYTKSEVDALLSARNWKDPVVVATTAVGTLATSFENGDTVDGVTLVTGDRILIKDQASAIENGIYVVNASGAPTRASDFDATAEVVSSVVAVKKGTSNADTVWLCTSDAPVINTDAINFSQVGAAFSKASQAEAEAATDDAKYMTPLKTKQLMTSNDCGDGSDGDLTVTSGTTTLNPAYKVFQYNNVSITGTAVVTFGANYQAKPILFLVKGNYTCTATMHVNSLGYAGASASASGSGNTDIGNGAGGGGEGGRGTMSDSAFNDVTGGYGRGGSRTAGGVASTSGSSTIGSDFFKYGEMYRNIFIGAGGSSGGGGAASGMGITGGAGAAGGRGGGGIEIRVGGNVDVTGATLTANAANGSVGGNATGNYGGGGGGGGGGQGGSFRILYYGTLTGSPATHTATGGASGAGGNGTGSTGLSNYGGGGGGGAAGSPGAASTTQNGGAGGTGGDGFTELKKLSFYNA